MPCVVVFACVSVSVSLDWDFLGNVCQCVSMSSQGVTVFVIVTVSHVGCCRVCRQMEKDIEEKLRAKYALIDRTDPSAIQAAQQVRLVSCNISEKTVKSRSIARGKKQPFLKFCSLMVMKDATPLTPPSA